MLYGERSAVWDQAENRLHAQKALLELLARAGTSLDSDQSKRPRGVTVSTPGFQPGSVGFDSPRGYSQRA